VLSGFSAPALTATVLAELFVPVSLKCDIWMSHRKDEKEVIGLLVAVMP
jgi:hypothetical protein